MWLQRKEKKQIRVNNRVYIFWLVTETKPADVIPEYFKELERTGYEYVDVYCTLQYGSFKLTRTVVGCTISNFSDVADILKDTGIWKELTFLFRQWVKEQNFKHDENENQLGRDGASNKI